VITNADITIYNHRIDPGTRQTVYARHVIQDVSWYASVNVSAASGGLTGGDVYKIRIPPEALADGQPALESYRAAKEYLDLQDPSGNWTVQNGDYFCRGEGPEITKPSDLEAAHVLYGQVRSWGDNRRGGLPHIRIEGW
jgi:hypothetical protein